MHYLLSWNQSVETLIKTWNRHEKWNFMIFKCFGKTINGKMIPFSPVCNDITEVGKGRGGDQTGLCRKLVSYKRSISKFKGTIQ